LLLNNIAAQRCDISLKSNSGGTCRGINTQTKEKAEKSIFIYGTIFKKNELRAPIAGRWLATALYGYQQEQN